MPKKVTLIITSILLISFLILIILRLNDTEPDYEKFEKFFNVIYSSNLEINDNENNQVPNGFYTWFFNNLNDKKINMRVAFNIDKLLKYDLDNKKDDTEFSDLLNVQYSLFFAKLLYYTSNNSIYKSNVNNILDSYDLLLSNMIRAVDNGNIISIDESKILSFLNIRLKNDKKFADKLEIYNFLKFIEIANKLLYYDIENNKLPKSLEELQFTNSKDFDISYENNILKWYNLSIDFEKNNSKIRKLGEIKSTSELYGFELRNGTSDGLIKALTEFIKAEKIYIENSDIDFNKVQLPNCLTSLIIADSKVIGLEIFENLTNLTSLTLRNCKLARNEINKISKLTNLKYLEISNTKFDSIIAIENLVELEYLLADNTNISDLSGIEKMKKLKNLNLNNTYISDIENLSNNIELEELSIENTNIKTIESLKALKKLNILHLTGSKVQKKEIQNLRNLKNLHIFYTEPSIISKINIQKKSFYDTEI